MTTAALQASTAPISLPPISSIDFHTQVAHRPEPEVVQPLPPPPPAPQRVLPPLPYPYAVRPAPAQVPPPPVPSEYVHSRPIYPGIPSPYQQMPGRMPLPSTTDPNLIVAPPRHKAKEVKRRTKTGCLTCRKRRIKCDEGRPECRNCMKSKRTCQGYDPVFQTQGPHSLHPAPSAVANNISNNPPPTTSISNQPRRFTTTPISPPVANHHSSIVSSSPRDHSEYPFPRPPEQILPHINQPAIMTDMGSRPTPRTIESICTIAGTKIPSVPPIPPDSVPNLESIRKVYDIAFAPGLDKLLEAGQSKWFAREGFPLLCADRTQLGNMLAYLTLVSNHADTPTENATLASQEARVTWALLELCIRPVHDSGEEADRLARRCRALGAILTGEPFSIPTATMADFVHQEEVEPEPKTSALEKQLARRSEEFWKFVERAAASQRADGSGLSAAAVRQCRPYLDGMENRDVIYSMMLLASGGNGDLTSERELAKRYLETQANGRATNQVFATLSGMALRAFEG
ncbi:hypothetical protein AYO22_10883 [Fonsecaea multimorphosa]|nr:hypothetical protein AYO22_10883 [Fonsecaea multimorphosa]